MSKEGSVRSSSSTPVVLFQPPGACRTFTRSSSIYPPLGLCQLAAVAGGELAVVLDADAEGWSTEESLREVLARRPRLVGFTATSFTLDLIEAHARGLRDAGVTVIVGGPHATLEPLDVFRGCSSVSFVFRGEGEPVFRELCERVAAGKDLRGIAGVCIRGELPASEDPPRVASFDTLPWPTFSGLPVARYRCPDAKTLPMVTMMTARGCPHHCGYCSSPVLFGSKPRGWAPAAVVDEIERLQREHSVKQISFVDDVFSLPRGRALMLCREIARRGIVISWFCNARADQIDPELAEAMARAGCHQVYLGFESGSQRILDGVGKGVTVAELEYGAAVLKAVGIDRSVGFVVGLPGENDESVAESIALAHRVQPERIQFSAFTPLPGTPLGDGVARVRGTFHSKRHDQVGEWRARMYDACRGAAWGKHSL